MRFCNMLSAGRYSEILPLAERAISIMKEEMYLFKSSGEDWQALFQPNPSLTEYYHVLARACLGLRDFGNAIKHATTGLNFLEILFKALQDKSSPDAGALREMQMHLFEARGIAAASTGDLEGALIDFRACLALSMEFEQKYDKFKVEVKKYLMIVLAKLKAGKPRPHHTDDEIRAWNKELCIKEFSPGVYACDHCQARPSAEVSLKACGRCQRAWYCGADCQRASWAQHKGRCQPPSVRKLTVLPDAERARVLEDIGEQGYFVAAHHAGPGVVLRDAATGGLFESLSDQDVVFASDARLRCA